MCALMPQKPAPERTYGTLHGLHCEGVTLIWPTAEAQSRSADRGRPRRCAKS